MKIYRTLDHRPSKAIFCTKILLSINCSNTLQLCSQFHKRNPWIHNYSRNYSNSQTNKFLFCFDHLIYNCLYKHVHSGLKRFCLIIPYFYKLSIAKRLFWSYFKKKFLIKNEPWMYFISTSLQGLFVVLMIYLPGKI